MYSELEKPRCSERLSDRRKRFPLGLGDGWTDSEGDDETPVPTKKRLSLSLKKPRSNATHLPCATREKNAPDSEGDDETPVPNMKRLSLLLKKPRSNATHLLVVPLYPIYALLSCA